MGQLAVRAEFTGTEVYGSVYLISVSLVDQGLDHIDHAVNLLSCQRMGGSRFYIHVGHILLALGDVTLRYLACGHALLD